jgi:hypothetical protein
MASLLERIQLGGQTYKGKENKVADALRRRFHGLFEINISRVESDLGTKNKENKY